MADVVVTTPVPSVRVYPRRHVVRYYYTYPSYYVGYLPNYYYIYPYSYYYPSGSVRYYQRHHHPRVAVGLNF
jgi:hypothetical protein